MICKLNGCDNTISRTSARGWCKAHYTRWLKYGDPLSSLARPRLKHGKVGSLTYGSWASAIQRCHNPNKACFRHYGANGVTVCERWRKFENFLADMGERPEGTTLGRFLDTGNYEPDNCKWMTPKEQGAERSKKYALSGELDQTRIAREREQASYRAFKWDVKADYLAAALPYFTPESGYTDCERQQRARLVELVRQGKSLSQLSRSLKKSRATVARRLREMKNIAKTLSVNELPKGRTAKLAQFAAWGRLNIEGEL